jgi:hypothetical protein
VRSERGGIRETHVTYDDDDDGGDDDGGDDG